ncbi:AAA family ATPase [Ornithinibacillus sp. L9]|uniref:AAA family ATPase n=1 Tax=Ornithinibacillus caprae TaxID=2678566 RepID=A0A6N8FN57_9BACI|nr:AAA family ATPase [Ornithinibacillus caprae]MUK90216.1 AAA family ATPase [Ornithinibacillus caprae]
MKKVMSPLVIAVGGVSGGGKTTVSNHLHERLSNSKLLHFDDYNFEGPNDIIDWVDRGANYDEWNLDPFIRDINTLLKESLDYIFLDYPFAYRHTKTSEFIDYTVYIDTPLDIAMARRVLRDFNENSNESILSEMKNYVAQGRRGYLEMLKSIKPKSDLIVDGTLYLPVIGEDIIEAISTITEHP